MLRVTFDTNVLLSATLWDGSVAQKLLYHCIRNNIKIYSSWGILHEYQDVLKRDFGYKDEEIAVIVEKILQFAILVEPLNKLNIVKEDPDDDKIIECAVESCSEYIITYDKHLLKIRRYEKIITITPEKALKNWP